LLNVGEHRRSRAKSVGALLEALWVEKLSVSAEKNVRKQKKKKRVRGRVCLVCTASGTSLLSLAAGEPVAAEAALAPPNFSARFCFLASSESSPPKRAARRACFSNSVSGFPAPADSVEVAVAATEAAATAGTGAAATAGTGAAAAAAAAAAVAGAGTEGATVSAVAADA